MTPAELLALANAATTGPWQADDRDSQIEVSSIEFHVAQIDVSYDSDFNREQCEADARLIALAPDLARLCAELAEVLENIRDISGNHKAAQMFAATALAKLSELEAR